MSGAGLGKFVKTSIEKHKSPTKTCCGQSADDYVEQEKEIIYAAN